MKFIADTQKIYRSALSAEEKKKALFLQIEEHFKDPLCYHDAEFIEDAVCIHYRIEYPQLLDLTRRGTCSEARQMLYYILHIFKGYGKRDICARYHIRGRSAVAKGIQVVKDCILLQAKEADDLDAIRNILNN